MVLIDTDAMDIRFVPIAPLRERRSIEGTYEQILAREDVCGDYLKITVTDRYAGLDLLSQLRSRFPYLLELKGKGLEEEEGLSALSVEELEKLDEVDIMMKYMAEGFSYTPTEEQLALFREVLALSREEGELG